MEQLVNGALAFGDGARLEHPNVEVLSLILKIIKENAAVFIQVTFVSHQELENVLVIAVLVDVVHVVFHGFESLGRIDSVHDNNSM